MTMTSIKKLTTIGLSLLLITCLSAAPMPQPQLDRVNAYIETLLGQFSQMASVRVTRAATSDSSGLLSSTEVALNFMDTFKASVDVEFEGETLVLGGSLQATPTDLGMTYDQLYYETLDQAREAVDAVNKQGLYKATLEVKTDDVQSEMAITLVPASDDPNLSIQELEVKVSVAKDLEAEGLKASMKGTFNSSADNVTDAQLALTNMATALSAQREPREEDFETLGRIIGEVLEGLDRI